MATLITQKEIVRRIYNTEKQDWLQNNTEEEYNEILD